MLREMIDFQDNNSLTQGTIFNCASSRTYHEDETLGLIITARCDIANKDKVRFYNFIPVIPFCKWREKELFFILKKRNLKNLRNNLIQQLKPLGLNESILNTYGMDRVNQIILEGKTPIQAKASGVEKISKLIGLVKIFEGNGSDFSVLSLNFKKEIEKIIDELISNSNSDYFFIDDIKGYGQAIVNLREIYELEVEIADKIPHGIEIDKDLDCKSLNLNLQGQLCSIVGQMRSPYIELLMQRFTHNFIRIGIDNPHGKLTEITLGYK